MLTRLKLVQPTTAQEASNALADYGDKAKIYAGGAELLLGFMGDLDPEVRVKSAKAIKALWASSGMCDLTPKTRSRDAAPTILFPVRT